MARKSEPVNLLDLTPVRLMEHRLEEDKVIVLIPKYRSRWMGWLQRRLKRPFYLLHLDEIGSAFWLACDGQRNISAICARVKERLAMLRYGIDDIRVYFDNDLRFLRQFA